MELRGLYYLIHFSFIVYMVILSIYIPKGKMYGYYMDFFKIGNETGARCLDGSDYGVYYASGYNEGMNSILINFEGGGWCFGSDENSFLSDCYERSRTDLGSSLKWDISQQNATEKFMRGNITEDPYFYNWHRLLVPYCDGTGHQGIQESPKFFNNTYLYFRGHLNVLAALDFIFSKVKKANLERIVLSGCSAGGLAAINWAEYVKKHVHAFNKKVKISVISDSGFFIDYGRRNDSLHAYKQSFDVLYKMVNQLAPPAVGKNCLNANKGNESKCLFASEILKFTSDVPVLLIQPMYDSWQIANILGENCISSNYSLSDCTYQQLEDINKFKNHQLSLIDDLMRLKTELAVWSPACLMHCFYGGKITSDEWRVPNGSSNSIISVVGKFMASGEEQVGNRFIDEVDWPLNKGCSNV